MMRRFFFNNLSLNDLSLPTRVSDADKMGSRDSESNEKRSNTRPSLGFIINSGGVHNKNQHHGQKSLQDEGTALIDMNLIAKPYHFGVQGVGADGFSL